ncbi:MAG: bile acid:sodium symporter family protein [Myxococcales bacterium]|nr:bile acid:sodium symporter family protein [Myxococcales bacterium]
MQPSPLLSIVLPIALGVIMLGLGLALTWADFQRVARYPRAVTAGLAVQAILLPAVAFGLAHAFALPPELAVGMVLLAASPGGATANLFSHLAGGDVALNLTLTAINSVAAIVTVPLLVGLGMAHFMAADKAIPLQFGKVIGVLLVVFVPVAIGMAIRKKKPSVAAQMDKPVKIASAAFLLLVIAGAAFEQRESLGKWFGEVGLATLLFNLASLGIGYALPRLLRLDERQSAAIAFEIGIHNGTMAIAVAGSVLGNLNLAIPAAVYSLIMYFTGAAFAAWVKKRTALLPVAG